MEELGQLRQRRIFLEAHEEFMEEEIGDLAQTSQVSGFYCPGMGGMGLVISLDDLVIVGKSVVLHAG